MTWSTLQAQAHVTLSLIKKVIHVNRFDLASELLESTDAKSALVTITLGTELKDATDIRTQQSFTTMQRNWQ